MDGLRVRAEPRHLHRRTRTEGAGDPLSAQTSIVCNTTVHGDLVIAGSGVAAPWDIGQCGPNVIDGDLVFAGNHASGNSIEGNTVDRNLVCARNGGLTSSGNTVKGRTQGRCSQ